MPRLATHLKSFAAAAALAAPTRRGVRRPHS